jgi:hypothetical protein
VTAASYLAGIGCLVGIVGPWVAVAPLLRRRLLPAGTAAQARLAECVLGLSGLLVVSEAVGAFGGFDRVGLSAASVCGAGLVAFATRRRGDIETRLTGPRDANAGLTWRVLPAAAAAFLVTAQWFAGILSSYRTGILQIESLHYHLPHAAYFEQAATLWRPHEVSPSSDAAFHPLNVELLHGLGMVALHTDFASLFVGLGLLWLALLAAWVVGERAGAGPAAVCGLAVLEVSLPLGGVGGGTALNDVAVIGFVLAAAAFADRSPMIAGLALGLAVGTKLSAPVVVVVLAAGCVWLYRQRGWVRSTVAVAGPLLLTGGFWYVRDWWFFASPLPSVSLKVAGIGFTKVPTPQVEGTEFSVAHYLTDSSVVRHWFEPALRIDFGPLWPLLLVLPLIGIAVTLRRGRPAVDRMIAVAALVAAVAYLFTPTGAQGAAGHPVLFGSNVRYVMPALALGIVLLVRDPLLARWQMCVSLVLLGLAAGDVSAQRFWPDDRVGGGVLASFVTAAVVAVLVGAWRWHRSAVVAVAFALLVATVVAGLPAERRYLSHRYTSSASPLAAVYARANRFSGERIAGEGFPLLYPLYGARFANQVQYVGQAGPDHAFVDFASCRAWAQAVDAAGYQYLVVLNGSTVSPGSRFASWARHTGATEVFSNPAGWIYRVSAPLAPGACPLAPRPGR